MRMYFSRSHMAFTFLEEAVMFALTHWSRVRHICVNKLAIIDSSNDSSPGQRQAIIWTKAGILVIGPLETNFSDILIEIQIFIQGNAFENVVFEIAAVLSRPQCVNKIVAVSQTLLMHL